KSPVIRDRLRVLIVDRQIPYISGEPPEFKIFSRLGSGQFGSVSLCEYKTKLYALKNPNQSQNTAQRANILDEGIKLTDFKEQHPNIQHLNYVYINKCGLLLDYCNNGSLDIFVKEKENIHRDVKMQNILLKNNCQTLVLTDYGTATQLGKSWMTDNVGTPITMAPEVFEKNQYGEKCDTYSWAIVLWQLISRQTMPYGNQGRGFLFSVVKEKLRPPKVQPCPKLFSVLIYRCWHSNPDERPSLLLIKNILKLIIDKLPVEPGLNPNNIQQLKKEWLEKYDLPEKYLPVDPKLSNKQSINIYNEHVNLMKAIIKIQHDIELLKQKNEQKEEYYKLKDQNNDLIKQIETFRT
ncbi:unnamed protein product, partial [Didymodactylos carnosus]